MARDWDERAKDWDQDERVRFYADQAFQALVEHVNVLDREWTSKRALDFGCGTGVLTEMLAPLLAEVIAVDTSPKMISVLGKKNLNNVTAICADIDDDSVRACAPWFTDFDLNMVSYSLS